jgi:hypothetical protein
MKRRSSHCHPVPNTRALITGSQRTRPADEPYSIHDSRVGAEEVDRAEALLGLGDQHPQLLLVCDVACEAMPAVAELRRDRSGRPLRREARGLGLQQPAES